MWTDKLGGRKFILAIIIIAVTTAIVLYKGALDSTFSMLLLGVLGAFGLANVAEKKGEASAPSLDVDGFMTRVEALENAALQMQETQNTVLKHLNARAK
jgi:hypothetical protein